MQRRNKAKILNLTEKLYLACSCLKKEETDIKLFYNDFNTNIVKAAELLVAYGDCGVSLINDLEALAIKVEEIKAAYLKGVSLTVYVELLQKLLDQLQLKSEETLPDDRKLIMFLPYKASMWDSLESVWEKVTQSADCDAVVMPIPYFDRNQDGTVREWHWEGDEFPENVPIQDYRAVNLMELHPDEIFIHNPYDGCNDVTSVHPDFYSDKLVSYTDKLVYIPYFVLDENMASVEAIRHFAIAPALVYAHLIILQSEKIKDLYIQALVEEHGETSKEYWESKIVGWGSPKLKKIHSDTREKYKIPYEWQNKIIKSSGELKKVILYGTGLTEMLKSGDKLLDKIENTLEFFKSKTESVILLWRPHPLIMPTLNAMMPELSQRYAYIVNKYKDEDWGIYDDTADLHRAIVLSDAYYGDGSSVTRLFQEMKKPVMLENVNVINLINDITVT